jgi:hypothetical protein
MQYAKFEITVESFAHCVAEFWACCGDGRGGIDGFMQRGFD